jgi:hypothetical protein
MVGAHDNRLARGTRIVRPWPLIFFIDTPDLNAVSTVSPPRCLRIVMKLKSIHVIEDGIDDAVQAIRWILAI